MELRQNYIPFENGTDNIKNLKPGNITLENESDGLEQSISQNDSANKIVNVHNQGYEYPSIQAAVDDANPGDTITIAEGTYKENVHVNKSLTIIGAGADKTIIDGNRTGSVFNIGEGNPDIEVNLSGILIQNGIGTLDYILPMGEEILGGGILNNGTLTVDHCTIQNNGDPAGQWTSLPRTLGGGICSSGNIKVTDSNILNNQANGGGGIFLDNYGNSPIELKSEIIDSTISGNQAVSGAGGVSNYGGDLTIISSTISGNGAGYSYGGGIQNTGTVEMVSGNISGNGASGNGGGVMNYGTFTMKDGTISDNTAYNGPAGTWFTGAGGGLYNNGGTLNLDGGSISNNHAYDGAGIYSSSGTLSIGGTIRIVSNGPTGGYGGGIYSGNSLVIFDGTNVAVQFNKAYLPAPSELSWYQGWGVYLASGIPTTTSGFNPAIQVVGNTLALASPPNTPYMLSGPISGTSDSPYIYSTSASDPNGDQVKYTFDWGDDTTDSTSFVDSGTKVAATHTWKNSGTYQLKAKAIDSNGASSAWSDPLSVTIIGPNENIAVDLIIEKNAILETEQVPISVKVASNSNPLPAEIELMVNGETVLKGSGTELTYLFGPSSAGSYDIMATASVGGLSERKPGKIVVLGDVSSTLSLAEELRLASQHEIFESEDIAISRFVSSVIDVGSEFLPKLWDKLKLKEIIGKAIPLEEEMRAYRYIEGFIGACNDVAENAVSLGPDPIKEFAREIFEKPLGEIALSNNPSIYEDKNKIDTDSANFANFIKSNDQKFSDPGRFSDLFLMHQTSIQNIVQTKEVSDSFIGHTQDAQKSYWDNLDKSSSWITTGLIIIGIIIAIIVGIAAIISCGGIAWACIIALAGSFGSGIQTFFWVIGMLSKGAALAKLLVALSLLTAMPIVCNYVATEHSNSISDIENCVLDSLTSAPEMADPLKVQANDILFGQATEITSNGNSFVVTPDGRISRFDVDEGNYRPEMIGRYAVMGYQHRGNLFSSIASTSFKVSEPNISFNTSYTVQNKTALISLQVTNHENSTMGNLIAFVDIRNSTKDHIYANGDCINLTAGESKNLSYEVNLEDNDIYTATASVSQDFSAILAEKTFPIPIGISTIEDAAILGIDCLSEYSPHDNVTMNVTVQSYSPAVELNISIPSLNYTKPVTITGTEEMEITLPKLKPDYYTIGLIAEKDGKVLDSRMVNFYVRADGVGLLTFNTSQILYTVGELTAINLSLKDLNLTNVDARISVNVRDPSGATRNFAANKTSDGYQFNFLPTTNGTYILEAHAYREGWRIDNNTFTVIASQMSPMKMNVTMGKYILANVTANGQPAACNVTIYTPQGNESIITSNGFAIFNASNQFYIIADKMFFEPAFYAFKPYNISGIKFDDANGNGTRDENETGLSGWTIKLIRPDGTSINTTTDANGTYKFENLTAGMYTISEIAQPGWTQTYPASLGSQIVNITDENVSDINFGNQQKANSPPDNPSKPSGNSAAISSTACVYSTSSTDPDGGQISYTFDWGDGANTTTDPFSSGANASSTHSWTSPGQYEIRAKATDSKGASSNWSDALTLKVYCKGWDGLGGIIISNPFMIKDDQGKTHIFVRGGDNALWDNVDGSWQSLGGAINSDPYAVKDSQGKIHVLVRGGDAALWDRVLDGGWTCLGGAITSNPSATLSADNHIKVAVRGADNSLWVKDITADTWTPLGGVIISNPQAIVDSRGRMHILVRGGDNALWDNIDGSWKPLGGIIASDPRSFENPLYPGYIHTFIKGGDNALWRNDLNASDDTSTWHGLGGVIAQNGDGIAMGNPFAVADVNGVVHAFIQGSDTSLWDNADGNWQGFGGFIKSSPNAIRDENGWIQVAIVGGDDALWVNRYGPA